MKYFVILTILLLLVLSGCGRPRPIQYTPPYVSDPEILMIETHKSFDETWTETIRWFAFNNIQVKVFEKDSGFISAEGSYVDAKYFHCGKYNRTYTDVRTTGNFNVMVENFSSNKSRVRMTLKGKCVFRDPTGTSHLILDHLGISSGYLEDSFYSFITDGIYVPRERVVTSTSITISESDGFEMIRSVARKVVESRKVSELSLYDQLEVILINNYKSNDDLIIDSLSWVAKALATSNNKKFIESLQEVANNAAHRKLQGHAQNALTLLKKL